MNSFVFNGLVINLTIRVCCKKNFQKGLRNVHPFFHSEQPYAVFPFSIVPFPHKGHFVPTIASSCGSVSVAVLGEETTFLLRLVEVVFFFWGMSLVTVLCIGSSAVMVMRRFVLSLNTLLTISLTICFNSFKNCLAS